MMVITPLKETLINSNTFNILFMFSLLQTFRVNLIFVQKYKSWNYSLENEYVVV